MTDVTVYSAALVLPISAPPIVDGAVAVRDGRILHVGERAWVAGLLASRGIAFAEHHWRGTLMPGLVNAHTHLQYTDMDSVGRGQYQGFRDWVAAFNAEYAAGSSWRDAAIKGARLCLAAGTTAVADIVTDAPAKDALSEVGLHGIAYWEVMDWTNEEWAERGREAVERALSAMPTTPGAGLSPHAPYSLEVDALMEIPDIARERAARLHIHLGESEIERPFDHEADQPWHARRPANLREVREAGLGVSATDYVDHLGVLGPDCHVAHGIYMTADDRALLRARHTSVALCPRSNAVIGLDAPPVAAYLSEGNPIAVGTDSLASSPSLDLLADVAALAALAREQGYGKRDLASRLLTAATLGGARALGYDVGPQRTGHLAVGARADLAFFDVTGTTPDDAMHQLVEAGAGTARGTIVAGSVLFAADAFTEQTGLTQTGQAA